MKARKIKECKQSLKSPSYTEKLALLVAYCETGESSVFDAQLDLMLQSIPVKFPCMKSDFVKWFNVDGKRDSDYIKLKKLMFVAAYLESPDKSHVIHYMRFARTLYDLFGSFHAACSYLHRHVQPEAKQPVHDACIFQLPKEGSNWNYEYWRRMVLKYGRAVTRVLPLAPKIDVIREQRLKGKNQNELIGKNELQRLRIYTAALTYKNAGKHPELAALCMKFNKSESVFEKCLQLTQGRLKTQTYLPDIEVEGKDINEKFTKFRMVKLPMGDLRGFFLGDYTNCCQNIGGNADSIAQAGMISPYADFYVIYNDKDEIVAQMFAWIGKDNKIIFDSWEPKVSQYNYLFKPFVIGAVKPIIDAGFDGLRVGMGGRTPKDAGFVVADKATKPIKNSYNYDANMQLVICDVIPSQQERIARFTEFANRVHISAKKFIHLVDSEDPAADIFNILGYLDTSEIMLLYQYFFASKLAYMNIEDDCTDELDLEFMSRIFQAYNAGKHVDAIRGFFHQLLDKGYIQRLDMDALADYLCGHLIPRDRMNGPRAEFNPTVILVTISTNLTLFEEHDCKYVKFLNDFVFMILLPFGGNGCDRECFENNLFEVMHELVADDDAPKSLRSLFLNFILSSKGRGLESPDIIKPYLDFVSVRHLIVFDSLLHVIKAAINLNDPEVITELYKKMLAEGIGCEETMIDCSTYSQGVGSYDATIALIAIASGSHEAARVLFNTFCGQEQLRQACEFPMNYRNDELWKTIIGRYVIEGNDGGIRFVRSLAKDDQVWNKIMSNNPSSIYKSDSNALHFALSHSRLDASLAIIQGYKDVIHLHALLTSLDSVGKRPLSYISNEMIQDKPEVVNAMTAAICKVYANNPELLRELADDSINSTLKYLLIRAKPKFGLVLFGDNAQLLESDISRSWRPVCFRGSEGL